MSNEVLRLRAHGILASLKPGEALHGDDHAFMLDVLKRHPEAAKKIGAGIERFEIGKARYGKLGFFVVRVDGTRTDFSYLKCLQNKPSHGADLARAFRDEIDVQIRATRDAAFSGGVPVHCPITGELLTATTCHVDHDPPFVEVVRGFMEANAIVDIRAVALAENSDGDMHHRLASRALATLWQQYHARVAKLRVVSISANGRILTYAQRLGFTWHGEPTIDVALDEQVDIMKIHVDARLDTELELMIRCETTLLACGWGVTPDVRAEAMACATRRKEAWAKWNALRARRIAPALPPTQTGGILGVT